MILKNHEIVAAILAVYFLISAVVPAWRLPFGRTTWGYRPGRGLFKVSSSRVRLPMVSCLGCAMLCSGFALGDRISEAHSGQLMLAAFNVIVVGWLCGFLLHAWRTIKKLDDPPARFERKRFTRRERRQKKLTE
jgi:hypothetical protein